jgi:hypothetical protein
MIIHKVDLGRASLIFRLTHTPHWISSNSFRKTKLQMTFSRGNYLLSMGLFSGKLGWCSGTNSRWPWEFQWMWDRHGEFMWDTLLPCLTASYLMLEVWTLYTYLYIIAVYSLQSLHQEASHSSKLLVVTIELIVMMTMIMIIILWWLVLPWNHHFLYIPSSGHCGVLHSKHDHELFDGQTLEGMSTWWRYPLHHRAPETRNLRNLPSYHEDDWFCLNIG